MEENQKLRRPPLPVAVAVIVKEKGAMTTREIYEEVCRFYEHEGWPKPCMRGVCWAISKLAELGIVKTRRLFRGYYGATRLVMPNGSKKIFVYHRGRWILAEPESCVEVPLTVEHISRTLKISPKTVRARVREFRSLLKHRGGIK